MSKAKYSKPMSMGEAARLVGFTGKHSAQRMRRYLRAREQAQMETILVPSSNGVRPKVYVTESRLRHHCPELFNRRDEGLAVLGEGLGLVNEQMAALRHRVRMLETKLIRAGIGTDE